MCIKNQIKPSLEITFFRPFPIMQHKMQHEKKETLKNQGFHSGDGGIRTHGRFDPSTDFEGKESFISVT